MIGEIAIKSGVSPEPILKAIGNDSRINPKFFKYGFGYGGPCFPRDTRAMTRYAKENGINPYIIQAVIKTNKNHLNFQIEQFEKENKNKNKPIIIDSVTYKPGTIIIEESQQLLFAIEIAKKGYKIIIREHPEVIEQVKRIYGKLFVYEERRNKR